MAELTLSSNEFRALSSETRVQIIKVLNERNHTLTELAKKMEMASPSMKQHLDILLNSGLIEQIDDGRKWKYYCLTRKGKNILAGRESDATILIVLGMSSIALICLIFLLIGNIASIQLLSSMAGEESATPSFETTGWRDADAKDGVVSDAITEGEIDESAAAPEISWLENYGAIYAELALIIVLAIIVGFFIAKIWKRKRLL